MHTSPTHARLPAHCLSSLPALPLPAPRLVSDDDPWAEDAGFLAEVMVATYEQRRSQVG